MAKKVVDAATQARYNDVADTMRSLYADVEFKPEEEDFEVLSTIRYDPLLADTIDSVIMFDDSLDNSKLFFLFEEHLRRINLTLGFFKFGYTVTRDQLLHQLNTVLRDLDKANSYKLRLKISKEGVMTVDVTLTPVRYNLFDGFNSPNNYTSPVWNVFLDTEPILISPFTSFKTTRRKRYDDARKRILLEDFTEPQEVLLYNTANQITEGTITNVAFKGIDKATEEEFWFTPVLASGCLCGVVRHMLLAKGLIQEKQISLKDVRVGDDVLLFNGIMGVVKGKIMDREAVRNFNNVIDPFL
jgi:branched-subunit amino acid aminotransferase/4-amino-4-deoxychorismate lyase